LKYSATASEGGGVRNVDTADSGPARARMPSQHKLARRARPLRSGLGSGGGPPATRGCPGPPLAWQAHSVGPCAGPLTGPTGAAPQGEREGALRALPAPSGLRQRTRTPQAAAATRMSTGYTHHLALIRVPAWVAGWRQAAAAQLPAARTSTPKASAMSARTRTSRPRVHQGARRLLHTQARPMPRGSSRRKMSRR
jgi:hypothetical protein